MQHCVQYCAQCCRSRSKFYFCNISRNNCTVCPPHCTQCCIVCPVLKSRVRAFTLILINLELNQCITDFSQTRWLPSLFAQRTATRTNHNEVINKKTVSPKRKPREEISTKKSEKCDKKEGNCDKKEDNCDKKEDNCDKKEDDCDKKEDNCGKIEEKWAEQDGYSSDLEDTQSEDSGESSDYSQDEDDYEVVCKSR